MISIKNLTYQVYSLLAVLLFFAFMPFLILCYLIILLMPYKEQIHYVYLANRLYINIWSSFVFIRYKVRGLERIYTEQNYIVIANHTNAYDMVGINSGLYVSAKPLVKKELFSVPLLGWLFRLSSIPVDRKNKLSRKLSLERMIDELNKGISLLIFPEGTRNRGNSALNAFHDGAFRLAKMTNTPILPVVFTNIRKLQSPNSFYFKPGCVHIEYLPVVQPNQFESMEVDDLKDYCFDVMREKIIELEQMN